MKNAKIAVRMVRDVVGLGLVTVGLRIASPRTVVLFAERVAHKRDQMHAAAQEAKGRVPEDNRTNLVQDNASYHHPRCTYGGKTFDETNGRPSHCTCVYSWDFL